MQTGEQYSVAPMDPVPHGSPLRFPVPHVSPLRFPYILLLIILVDTEAWGIDGKEQNEIRSPK